MDEQTNSGRAFALYAVAGIVFIGLLFAGIAFFKQRNSQMANNRPSSAQVAVVTPPAQDKAVPSKQNKATEQQKAAQDKTAQDKAATDKRAQQEATDKAAEQKKVADAKVAADKAAQDKATQDKAAQDKVAQDKANAAKPVTVQPTPVAPATGPGEVPATGSATDYAMTSFAIVLLGFGVVRWRQSKLQLQRSLFTRA